MRDQGRLAMKFQGKTNKKITKARQKKTTAHLTHCCNLFKLVDIFSVFVFFKSADFKVGVIRCLTVVGHCHTLSILCPTL